MFRIIVRDRNIIIRHQNKHFHKDLNNHLNIFIARNVAKFVDNNNIDVPCLGVKKLLLSRKSVQSLQHRLGSKEVWSSRS